MSWTHKGVAITDDSQFPTDALGFVYLIKRISDGKFYFGKKLTQFTKTSVKTVTLKSGVKKKKKVKTLVPSDWKTYWSSSLELVKDVELLGEAAFTREILVYCRNKGTLGYMEARYQMDARVLEKRKDGLTYNGIISCRINWAHLKPLVE